MSLLTKTLKAAKCSLSKNVTLTLLFSVLIAFGSKGAAMSGTYTICASGCTYASYTSAVSDLTSNGVSGAVTFNVASGNYNEAITIGSISGASSTNTITFKGAGAGKTRIYNALSSTSAVVYLSYSKYITFSDMTIEYATSSATSYKYAAYVYYSDYNNFTNCRIFAPATTSYGVYAVYHYYCNYNTFTNNYIRGGYYTMYDYQDNYCKYIKNRVMSANYSIMYNYFGIQNTYDGNFVDSCTSGSTPFVAYYETGATYVNNQTYGVNGYNGLFTYNANYSSTSNPFTIENNLFNCQYGGSARGILLAYPVGTVVIRHNTVNMVSPGSPGTAYQLIPSSTVSIDLRNNNFQREKGGTVAEIGNSSYYSYIDGNNYYNKATGAAVVSYNSVVYSSISAYQAVSTLNGHGKYDREDMNNFILNKAGGTDDLHYDQNKPNPSSPFIGIAVDKDGDARCKIYPSTGGDESNYGKGKFKANFFGPDTVYVNSPAVYTNAAKAGSPMTYKWYVNGVYITDSIDLVATTLVGPTSTIKLVTTGCAGTDSITKTIIVVKPSAVPVVDFVASKNVILQGQTVDFTDLSNNGPSAWKWDISPKTCVDPVLGIIAAYKIVKSDSDQNVKITFYCPGKYNICLTASNVVGSGTQLCKKGYIDVIPTINMCDANITHASSGYLFDNGGPNGPVLQIGSSSPGVCGLVLDPCADTTYLVIDEFSLWCTLTYLRIYDGTDNKGKVINGTMGTKQCTSNNGSYGGPGFTGGTGACYSGTGLMCMPTLGDTFIATSGKMYIELSTYYANYYPSDGFKAHWWGKKKAGQAPTAKFDAPDSVCTNSLVTFNNLSTGAGNQYFWDLDGDISTFEDTAKQTTWPYFSSGLVDVTLIVVNCGGTDSFTKTINVYDPNPPKAAFTVDNAKPTLTDVVQFSPKIVECVDNYIWTITNASGKSADYVLGTTNYSQFPLVSFPDTGCWNVKLVVINMSGSDSILAKCFVRVKNSSYCIPGVGKSIPDIGISRVTFNTIDKSSTQGIDGYQNFTTDPNGKTTTEIGVSYDLTVYRNTPMYNNMSRAVWIDWNQDATFDASEKIAEEKNALTGSWKTTIKVPANAVIGATIMRIATNYGKLVNKVCGGNQNGEYEDYRLYVSPDVTAPVITLVKPNDTVWVEQGATYTDPGYTAIDNLDGNITPKVIITSFPKFNNLIPNTYTFKFNVKDAAGNAAIEQKRIVVVKPDKNPPVIVLYGNDNDTVQVLSSSYTDPGVKSAYDLVDGNLLSQVIVTGTVDVNKIGVYQITYTVSDFSGNKAVKIRYVNVIDSIAPTVAQNGSDTIHVDINEAINDPGYVYSDNYYTNAELTIYLNGVSGKTVSDFVDNTTSGFYTVTYSVEDPSGNMSTVFTRVFEVSDKKGPEITLNGLADVTIEGNTVYTDPGYTASDNVDGKNVTVTVAGTYHVAFDPSMKATALGDYTITYAATDKSGNATLVTRKIHVIDDIAPVITLKGPLTATACRWRTYVDSGYTVTDNFYTGTDVTVTMTSSVSTDLPGLVSFKYKAVDKSGNVSYSDARIVLVKETGECASGIADTKNDDIVKIYPNPNAGQFYVTVDANRLTSARIFVTNMMGQTISSINDGLVSAEKFTVNLSNQPAGVYFVNIITDKGAVIKKVNILK